MVEVSNLTKAKLPKLPWLAAKNRLLGRNYQLSLAICGDRLSRKLNQRFLKKKKAADVLAFPLSVASGEIFLNLAAARREAKKFRQPFRHRLFYLFLHGLLHLAGFKHGRAMTAEEKRLLKKFG